MPLPCVCEGREDPSRGAGGRENWYSESDLELGQVKWLGLASGYGHLKSRIFSWQPVPVDRAIRVDLEKL
jgi:hypothetical protein